MAKSKVKNENYIVIQGWMINELKLKGNELLIYAIIFNFSQQDGWFKETLSFIIKWTKLSKHSVINCIKSLLCKNSIEKKEEYINNIKYCYYRCLVK